MKNREQIEAVLDEEYHHRDGTKPMDEMDWANNQGWIEALEFVLDIQIEKPKDIIYLLKGANNDTIKRALERLSKKYGFGRKNDVIDSENDNIRDGLLYAPIQKKQSLLQQNSA